MNNTLDDDAILICIVVVVLTIVLMSPLIIIAFKGNKPEQIPEQARIVMVDGTVIESKIQSIKTGKGVIELHLK